MITFDDVWNFIETTHVSPSVLYVIDPKTQFTINWKDYIKETYWEQRFDLNTLEKMWEDCYSFIVLSTSVTKKLRSFIENIESERNVSAQSHIYMGKLGSKSFPIHADNPDNLIIQCIGSSRVTLYNEYRTPEGPNDKFTIQKQTVMTPGSEIYIPSQQFHQFEPLEDRLSISIPMYKNEQ